MSQNGGGRHLKQPMQTGRTPENNYRPPDEYDREQRRTRDDRPSASARQQPRSTARRPESAPRQAPRRATPPSGGERGQGRPPQPPRQSGGRWAPWRPWQYVGVALSVLLIGVTIFFCVRLTQLGLIPNMYRNLIFLFLAAVDACILVLQLRRARAIGSKVICVLMTAVLLFGSVYVSVGVSTISDVTGVNTQLYCVAVYVLADDPAETIQDATGYSFGILEVLDRDNTDACLEQIAEDQNASVTATAYASMPELATALLDGQVQAIVLNTSYLGVLDDLSTESDISEDLVNFSSLTKSIAEYSIERVIATTAPTTASDTDEGTGEDTGEDGTTADDADDGEFSITEDPFVVYISGNDSYGSLASTGRSDVNILAVVNPSTHHILLVSTPRDYYVELSALGSVMDKLTHAGIYGVDVSMSALEWLYDIDIRYYVRMNFTGFVEIIDALGGITVDSDYSFSSVGYSFSAGENYQDGAAALVFARERHSFSEGDRQRGRNQMAVIEAVIDKATSSAILTNYVSVMNAASGAFATNVSQDEISQLVQWQLSSGESWTVESTSVTGTDSSGPVYSMGSLNVYRMLPDDSSVAAAVTLINQVLNGE